MHDGNTESAQQAASPDSTDRLFQHESWQEPWSSLDFPLNESCIERQRRFEKKPWWTSVNKRGQMQEFIARYAFNRRFWPWGFVIYRTTYSSNEVWKAALNKLNRYFDTFSPDRVDEPDRIVREGHRDVIIEDPALEGVAPRVIQLRHLDWLKQYGLHPGWVHPRTSYCLMMDERCVRSILASGDPTLGNRARPTGYVNVIDMNHNPEDPEYDEGPFYDGCVRLDLTGLFNLAYYCDDKPLCELYNYVPDPDLVPYTDGYTTCYNAPRSILVHRNVYKGFRYEIEPW